LFYDGTKLFAGTTSGLYFTTDNGATWSQKYLNGKSVNSIAGNGSIQFAGVGYAGVYSSNNGGTYWVKSVMHNYRIFSLYSTGDEIYTGSYLDTYKSVNEGEDWTKITSNHINSYSIVSEGNHFCEGTHYGAYYSSDGGATWTMSSINNTLVYALAKKGQVFFAGTYGQGVFYSTDYGATWTQTSLNNKSVLSLLVTGSRIYAGTDGSGVYYSDNDGGSWIQTSVNSHHIRSMATDNGKVFAACEYKGLYISDDNGNTWEQHLAFENLLSVCVLYPQIIAGTKASGVRYSDDGGASWSYVNSGLGEQRVNALLLHNGDVFAGTDGTSVWKTSLAQITGADEINPVSDGVILNCYPNPFMGSTIIEWSLASDGHQKLVIFDVRGKEIEVLFNGYKEKGTHKVEFDASALPAGLYCVCINIDAKLIVKKLIKL
jgi:photosystem II stability/assembly factor-like uncharacterized protein